MGVLRILDSSGDTTLEWDPAIEETVRAAEVRFERLLAERKLAFARPTDAPGTEAEQVRSFDPEAAEIILVRPIQGG